MKFNYNGRGFVVLTLATMLVVVGTVNYQLSKKSLLETNKELQEFIIKTVMVILLNMIQV